MPCSAWFCCAAYTCANTTTNSTACATKPQPPSSVYLSPAGRSVLVYLSLPPDTGGINIRERPHCACGAASHRRGGVGVGVGALHAAPNIWC